MFSRVALVVAVSFGLFAAAHNKGLQCSTGTQACCDSVQDSQTPEVQQLLGSLGLQVAADVLVGVECSPITVIGAAGGSSCSQQAVCCNDDNHDGAVAIGCTPINAAL